MKLVLLLFYNMMTYKMNFEKMRVWIKINESVTKERKSSEISLNFKVFPKAPS